MINDFNPTVIDVENKLIAIAEKYQFSSFKEVHFILGVSDRTLRRWRSKADENPLAKSSIPYVAQIAICSILEDRFILEDNLIDLRKEIPACFITNAENYVCPPFVFLKKLVGKKNLLKMTIKDLASRLRCSHVQLGADIKHEKISYLTFCFILMIGGFKPHEVFMIKKPIIVRKNKDLKKDMWDIKTLKEKEKITKKYNEDVKKLKEKYIKDLKNIDNLI